MVGGVNGRALRLPPFPSFNKFRMSGWGGGVSATVIPAPYRHSRVSGNPDGRGAAVSPPSFPRKRESGGGWAAKGWSFQYRRDSRLRGNDGLGPPPFAHPELAAGGILRSRTESLSPTAGNCRRRWCWPGRRRWPAGFPARRPPIPLLLAGKHPTGRLGPAGQKPGVRRSNCGHSDPGGPA